MSSTRPTDRASRLAYGLLALAFGAMAVFAIERTLRLEARMADEQRQRAEAQLERSLALWEDLQLDRIRASIQALSLAPLTWSTRPQAPVEAAYVWDRREDQRDQAALLVPAPVIIEDIPALLADPCMVQAAAAATPEAERVHIAAAWRACAGQAPQVALLAVSRAADQYLAAGQPAEALDSLQQVGLPVFVEPEQAAELGISVDRLVARQLQLAEAHRALGHEDQATALLVRVGQDMLLASGPTLDRVLPYLEYPVLADLRALGAGAAADDLERRAIPARRRLIGYREALRVAGSDQVSTRSELLRVSLPPRSPNAAAPRIAVSAFGEAVGDGRFLLVVAPLPEGLTVALQFDPLVLLEDLVGASTDRPLRVLDARSELLLPAGAAPEALVAQIPFGRLFPELRLGMVAGPLGQHASGWRASQLAPIAVVVLMAAFAMVARIRADRQLRELWERQQAFVNRVSHELKTPLAGVKVMAELIDLGIVSEPGEIKQNVQRIITEVSRMEDRVNEVLRLARRAEITSREELDLQSIGQHLVEVWTPRFEQKGARLSAVLEETAPVMGDRHLIRDAMSNLLDNALKYLDEGRPGLVTVRTATAGRWVIFEVTDNGMGVPEHMRRAIFQRFTRVEGDGRGKAGGHGLGLAFVAEAVGSHGGKVECRDGIAGGARFVIRLRRS